MNEADARVLRTRQRLQDALIELVNVQGYENTTVRDLAQKAHVGYKTFYRHYDGKEAFVQALVDETVADAQKLLLPPSDERAFRSNTATLLDFVETNAPLILTILHTPAYDRLQRMAESIAFQDGIETFRNASLPPELIARHFASSMITIVRWWLESGMSASKEEMAAYIDTLLIGPLGRQSI